MEIYLYKSKNNKYVVFHTSLEAAKIDGYTKKPDLTINERQWYNNDCRAYLDDKGNIILGKTPEEKAADESFKKRAERDQKLVETDKYMIVDFPISDECREEMKAYRQALRDLPANDNWPYVDLPEEPTIVPKVSEEEPKEEEPAVEEVK